MNKYNLKLLDRYEMICKNKGHTQESLKAIIKVDIPLFLKFIGDKHLEEVTHVEVEDFLFYCMNVRKNGDHALARKRTNVNMFYKTMIMKDYITCKNPCDKVDNIKIRKKFRNHLSIEEYQQILDYIDSRNDLRGGALFSLFFSSGCRLSEVWQQNRDSLNFETRRFKVLGKGQKERPCVFSQDAKERILKYLDSRTDELKPLFISRQNNRWSKKSIQDYVKKTSKRVGIKKNVHPHILRHTRAMALLKMRVPLETIQRLLGHENISTTQVYAHSNLEDLQEDIDEIDKLI